MSARRLRIAHVTIQPVLVWDDGEELTPGPDLQAFSVPISKAIELIGNLPSEVAALADQLDESKSKTEPPEPVGGS